MVLSSTDYMVTIMVFNFFQNKILTDKKKIKHYFDKICKQKQNRKFSDLYYYSTSILCCNLKIILSDSNLHKSLLTR